MLDDTKILTIRRFDDMHCHFRTNPILSEVVPLTARYASRGIAMPNTRPRAILNARDVMWYREEIWEVLDRDSAFPFEPLMTIEIRDKTTPEVVVEAHNTGAVAGKIYPLGVTTNSDEGLRDFFSPKILETFRAMEDIGMFLLLHGEIDRPRTLVTKREEAFLSILGNLAMKFPNLKIVLEHVSSRTGVQVVKSLGPNVGATITAHHLCLTLNDVIGDGIRPHNGCMPMPKDFCDRDALIEAATSGNPKFFLGSDSAPHLRKNKECIKGACGVFSAPVLPQVLAQIFEEVGKLDQLEDFASRFGAEFYGLRLNQGTITLIKDGQGFHVPKEIAGIVPFKADCQLAWRLL